jgi:hypothetical protein
MTTSRLLKEVKDGGPILRSPAETTAAKGVNFQVPPTIELNDAYAANAQCL